jgi:DNA replication protein DnaD
MLLERLGAKDLHSFLRARDELLKSGRIAYESNRDKRKSGNYRIVYFEEGIAVSTEAEEALTTVENAVEEVSACALNTVVEDELLRKTHMSTVENAVVDDSLLCKTQQTTALNADSYKTKDSKIVTLSIYKTEDNNTSMIDDLTKIESDPPKDDPELKKLITYYESEFGLPWCESVYRRLTMYNSPTELILYALKLTKEANEKPGGRKKDTLWATSLLRAWAEKGIKTLELAEQEAKKFYDRKKPGVSRARRNSYGPDPIPNEFWAAIGIEE